MILYFNAFKAYMQNSFSCILYLNKFYKKVSKFAVLASLLKKAI